MLAYNKRFVTVGKNWEKFELAVCIRGTMNITMAKAEITATLSHQTCDGWKCL